MKKQKSHEQAIQLLLLLLLLLLYDIGQVKCRANQWASEFSEIF